MRILIVAPFLLLAFIDALSQNKVNPIYIGEKMPDISLTNFIHPPDRIMKFSDLRGKLVILELWNTWCSSCIALMPKLDSLQKEFNNKIQIILVTENKK